MRLSASRRVPNYVCRLSAASFLAALLVAPAAAESPAVATAQTKSAPPVTDWGVTGSAPQTGSSAYTSGKAFGAANGQRGAAAPQSAPAEVRAPSALPANNPPTVELPPSKILVLIDKQTQEMQVFVDNVERYDWAVSTGKRGYDTPSGTYTARSVNEIWYSKQWDSAPMPHAIFFTKKGHAIHGTVEIKNLGRPASHGCVRIAPENATTLFALVKEVGVENTEIVLSGEIPPPGAKVANSAPRKQEIKRHEKTVTVLRRGSPGGKGKVASAGARKQKVKRSKSAVALTETAPSGGAKAASSGARKQVKPSGTYAYQGYDPRAFESPRRLGRRDWYRLYYSSPPQPYAPSPGRRFYAPY
jgi:lipoprotein-anchoring transpeptidase ErfK/SrfK